MKKIFALALAAVMTAGMTTVAFAANEEPKAWIVPGTGASVLVDVNDDGKFYTDDDDMDSHDKGAIPYSVDKAADVSVIEGGTKVALPLYTRNAKGEEVMFSDKDTVKGLKVKADWTVGKLEEKPEIELVKIGDNYFYAITFTVPEGEATKTTDLCGEISIYKNSSDLKDSKAYKKHITAAIGSEYGFEAENLYDISDLTDAKLVAFKDKAGEKLEGEETLTFGDLFEFEVDVTGQGKLNLKNNTDFNKEFAAMYDYANIDFLTFEYAPSFNKIGTAYIYADEDAYVYEVTEDGAKAIKGLEWDEDYEAWTFKTRKLGAYAISDVELDEKTVTEDNTSSTTDGGKTNPDTGR